MFSSSSGLCGHSLINDPDLAESSCSCKPVGALLLPHTFILERAVGYGMGLERRARSQAEACEPSSCRGWQNKRPWGQQSWKRWRSKEKARSEFPVGLLFSQKQHKLNTTHARGADKS